MLETHAITNVVDSAPTAQDEELYRQHFLRADARRALVVVAVLTAIWLAGIAVARNLFVSGRLFFVLLAVHTAAVLVNLAIGAVLLRSAEPRRHDRAIALFLATTTLTTAYVISTRPAEYIGYAVPTTFGLSLFYLVIPGPLAIRTGAAAAMSATTFWAVLRSDTPRMALSVVLSTHLLSHALGIPVARWLEALRRRGFFAQVREQRAREELAQKAAALAVAKERAETMARARTDFLATMSHEFRTPMNAVLGLSEMLAAAPLAPEFREMAQTVHQSARGLLVLLNDILDLSKIEAGRLLIEKAPFDVRQVVRSALDLVRHQAIEKRLELELSIGSEVPVGLLGDAARLRQVLLNLLSNALKFTERGSVAVSVALRSAEGADREVSFSVRDTGPGIPVEVQERLFAPYEQGNVPISKRRGGAGLGLSICKRLVGLMGGDIRVQSEPGKGALFVFWIQARATELPRRAAVDSAALTSAERRLKVLVVDDDALNQRVALAMFRKLGLRPDVARSGGEALRKLEEEPYDVIFMDLQMPEMDGIETTSRIRAAHPGPSGPRIVAMTASAFDDDRAACTAAGMADFVSKPVLMEELHAAVMRAVSARPANRERSDDAPATLSMEALARLRALETKENAGFFDEIRQMFASDAREILTRMAAAAKDGDRSSIERGAHSLKSTSGSFGATRMVEQCTAIEAAARHGELGACLSGIERIREELLRVEAALAKVVS